MLEVSYPVSFCLVLVSEVRLLLCLMASLNLVGWPLLYPNQQVYVCMDRVCVLIPSYSVYVMLSASAYLLSPAFRWCVRTSVVYALDCALAFASKWFNWFLWIL
jgi:hypothetical protein